MNSADAICRQLRGKTPVLKSYCAHLCTGLATDSGFTTVICRAGLILLCLNIKQSLMSEDASGIDMKDATNPLCQEPISGSGRKNFSEPLKETELTGRNSNPLAGTLLWYGNVKYHDVRKNGKSSQGVLWKMSNVIGKQPTTVINVI